MADHTNQEAAPEKTAQPLTEKVREKVRWYILFREYTEGLAMEEVLKKDGCKVRIAPTPRSIQKELSCGMSLMLEEEELEKVKASIEKHELVYHDIVPLAGQINARRDRFC